MVAENMPILAGCIQLTSHKQIVPGNLVLKFKFQKGSSITKPTSRNKFPCKFPPEYFSSFAVLGLEIFLISGFLVYRSDSLKTRVDGGVYLEKFGRKRESGKKLTSMEEDTLITPARTTGSPSLPPPAASQATASASAISASNSCSRSTLSSTDSVALNLRDIPY